MMTSERLVKTDKLQKDKRTLLANDMLTNAVIEKVASKEQPAVVKQEAKSQVSTGRDFMLGATGNAKNTSDLRMEDKHSTFATSNLRNSQTEHASAISLSQDKEIATQQVTSIPGVKMKPAIFGGSTLWIDYKTR